MDGDGDVDLLALEYLNQFSSVPRALQVWLSDGSGGYVLARTFTDFHLEHASMDLAFDGPRHGSAVQYGLDAATEGTAASTRCSAPALTCVPGTSRAS